MLYSHVFLGFSCDGQFVLSYTMQVDVTGIAVNSYRLQCWLFTPHKPLHMVLQSVSPHGIVMLIYVKNCSVYRNTVRVTLSLEI